MGYGEARRSSRRASPRWSARRHIGLREHIETLFAVHREFVAEPHPAWTAVGVTELLSKDAVLEIAVTAVRRESPGSPRSDS